MRLKTEEASGRHLPAALLLRAGETIRMPTEADAKSASVLLTFWCVAVAMKLPHLKRWKIRFSLRFLLALVTVVALLAAFVRRPQPPSRTVGPQLATVYMDVPLAVDGKTVVVHTTSRTASGRVKLKPDKRAPAREQVVVVVADVDAVGAADARAIADSAEFTGSDPAIHFLELINPATARIRSFAGWRHWQCDTDSDGVAAACWIINQLSFRLPKQQRKIAGGPDRPVVLQLAGGDSLELECTADWGGIYLRRVNVPSRWDGLFSVNPYSQTELQRIRDRNQPQAGRESNQSAVDEPSEQ